MKDAAGRTIKINDKIVYVANDKANAAVVTSLKPFKVRIISTTEYGTACGKEVLLGNKHFPNLPHTNILVIESCGKSTDFSEKLIKPYSEQIAERRAKLSES